MPTRAAPQAERIRARASAALAGLMAERTPADLLPLLEAQSLVLELIAEGTPLPHILDELVRAIERQADGMLCSILLLAEDGRHVLDGASPNLPERYTRAIEGAEIGPRAGSCGTAAFLRKQVIVTDIERDPLWAEWKDVALAAGLRACWSTPILSRGSQVLGTFAMYYRQPAHPSPLHLHLIELATHLAQVAIEADRAARERQRLLDELREADRRKGEFLAVLSHELRNPLAAIRTSTNVLDRAAAESGEASRARSILRRQSEHLGHMVDDLLDLTRISRGRLELRRERVDLREVVARSCEDHRASFEQARVELRQEQPSEPVWVEGDPTRLAQVVGNLLHNAAKFTPAGGVATVAVSVLDATAELCVRDTGAGMGAAELNALFEPLAQPEQDPARARGGLGLGLALVKRLVELHGGSVRARSDGPGHGAEFQVALPVSAGPATGAGTSVEAAASPDGRRRVLLIEDNADTCESLALALGLSGYQVRAAHDGETGIAMAHELKPDVVLCDIGLPGMDGYEVARALRADEGLRTTRLVALSGYARPEDKQRANDAGFEAHISKPAVLEDLAEVLAKPS